MTPQFKVGDVLLVDAYGELHLQEVTYAEVCYHTYANKRLEGIVTSFIRAT